jgi:hypothetical protein
MVMIKLTLKSFNKIQLMKEVMIKILLLLGKLCRYLEIYGSYFTRWNYNKKKSFWFL